MVYVGSGNATKHRFLFSLHTTTGRLLAFDAAPDGGGRLLAFEEQPGSGRVEVSQVCTLKGNSDDDEVRGGSSRLAATRASNTGRATR